MGWKNVKEHYQIGHIVQVSTKGICIGSPYIHDLIVIGSDGRLIKQRDSLNGDLQRYQREMEDDRETLQRLIEEPDVFTASIPVFTYDGGEIIEKRCEELGWPNVTHDGEMMFENTFSADKKEVVAWAKRNAASEVDWMRKAILEHEEKLADMRSKFNGYEANKAKLDADYPEIREENDDLDEGATD